MMAATRGVSWIERDISIASRSSWTERTAVFAVASTLMARRRSEVPTASRAAASRRISRLTEGGDIRTQRRRVRSASALRRHRALDHDGQHRRRWNTIGRRWAPSVAHLHAVSCLYAWRLCGPDRRIGSTTAPDGTRCGPRRFAWDWYTTELWAHISVTWPRSPIRYLALFARPLARRDDGPSRSRRHASRLHPPLL